MMNEYGMTLFGTAFCDSKRTWEIEFMFSESRETWWVVCKKQNKTYRVVKSDNERDAINAFTQLKKQMSEEFDK